jgi:chorismate mutase
MACRGIRGATCVETDDAAAILVATTELLERIVAANGVAVADVASVIFTVTPDLTAAKPARAAREMGWSTVPLICAQEMVTANDLPHCIRVLIHWNTDRISTEIRHVYLGRARGLRPDLAGGGAPLSSS